MIQDINKRVFTFRPNTCPWIKFNYYLHSIPICWYCHELCEYCWQVFDIKTGKNLTYFPQEAVLLVKLIGFQLVKKFPAFYGTRSSLPHSQVPATCLYP